LGDDAYFRLPDIRWGRQVTDEYWPTWEGEIRGAQIEELPESESPMSPSHMNDFPVEQSSDVGKASDPPAPARKITFMEKVKGLTSGSHNNESKGAVYSAANPGPWSSTTTIDNEAGREFSFYGDCEKPCSYASNASTTFGDRLEPTSFTSGSSGSFMVAEGCSFTSTGSNGEDDNARPSMELALRALAAAVDFVSPKSSTSNRKPDGHRRKLGGSLIDLAAQRQEKELRQQHRLQMKQQMKQNREKKSLIDLAAEERDRQLQQQKPNNDKGGGGSRFCVQCGNRCQPTFKFCLFCGQAVP
jgi:hypothetical protein